MSTTGSPYEGIVQAITRLGTIRQVSRDTGISVPTIMTWRQGTRSPSLESLARIAATYGDAGIQLIMEAIREYIDLIRTTVQEKPTRMVTLYDTPKRRKPHLGSNALRQINGETVDWLGPGYYAKSLDNVYRFVGDDPYLATMAHSAYIRGLRVVTIKHIGGPDDSPGSSEDSGELERVAAPRP